MKHFFKLTCLAGILTAGIFTLALFKKDKKVTAYSGNSIQLVTQTSR